MPDIFAVSDVVRLISGGPLMTVTNTLEYELFWEVSTVWFDGAGKLHKASFDESVLEFYDKENL